MGGRKRYHSHHKPSLVEHLVGVCLIRFRALRYVRGVVLYRTNSLRNKNRLLEEKVTQRTNELSHQKEELRVTLEDLKATQGQLIQQELLKGKMEIQEQTLKNVSEEIHDNVGQALTLLKLNLNTMDPHTIKSLEEKITESKQLISKAIQD